MSLAQWRDKGETLYVPNEDAAYYAKPEYVTQKKEMPPSTAPRYDDPLTRHQLCYLNGGGGSGKTTRAIELFRARDPLVFIPTHRLAKEMQTRGVKAQTYHSFFRYCGVRKACATEEDLVKMQQTRKYEGKAITVFKAKKDWNRDGDILVSIDGKILHAILVADKVGGELHFEGNSWSSLQITDEQGSVRKACATEEDLVKLQQTGKYEGKSITVFKAKKDWTCGAQVLVMIGGYIVEVILVAKKEGGVLHLEGESKPSIQIADADWTPERMGEKAIPRVIIWDEVCTVPRPTLETFLNWLDLRGVQVICCGDPGQPPPIGGEMPHRWLEKQADYYEEVEVDHRAKDDILKTLKKRIRLKPDDEACQQMRKALPSCLEWDRFVKAWKPSDLILASRKAIRDRTQEQLFQKHKVDFPDTPVPLLYHPKDSRKQNILVPIPGTDRKEELVSNDVVDVTIEAAEEALQTPDWCLGYALTIHSSQGLTIYDPRKVWIIDDFLQWSNLAYLAVSRVEFMHQLERVTGPPDEGSEIRQLTEQQLRNVVARKLVGYIYQDKNKGLNGFNLKVNYILQLRDSQDNRCAACNIELLWAYAPKDTQQFSVDRLDNSKGHTRDNVRLTCLECNRKRGGASLTTEQELDQAVAQFPQEQ